MRWSGEGGTASPSCSLRTLPDPETTNAYSIHTVGAGLAVNFDFFAGVMYAWLNWGGGLQPKYVVACST